MEYIILEENGRYIEYPVTHRKITGGTYPDIDLTDARLFAWNKLVRDKSVKEKSIQGNSVIDESYVDRQDNKAEFFLYTETASRSFYTKDCFFIAENQADINIKDFPFRMIIEHNHMTVEVLTANKEANRSPAEEQDPSRPADGVHEVKLFYNGRKIQTAAMQPVEFPNLQKGDYFLLDTVKLIWHGNTLTLCARENSIDAGLLETGGDAGHFEGFPVYRRSPRVVKRVPDTTIEINKAPRKEKMAKGGLLQLIIPPLLMMGVTVAMGILMKRGLYMLVSALATVMSIITSVVKYIQDQKINKAENKRITEVYEDYLLRKRKEIHTIWETEKEAWSYNYPDINAIAGMISEYSSRIYERNYNDEDFLHVGVGYDQEKCSFSIRTSFDELGLLKDDFETETRELCEEYRSIADKPVIIDLKRAHLGLVGEKKQIHEQLKVIVSQLTFFHSYHDLQFITIFDEKYNPEFKWMNWYPHFKIGAINTFGSINSEKMRDQVFGSMNQIMKERNLKNEENKKESKYTPHYVFIIDEPKLIMDHAIMEYLQKGGEELGFTIIYTTYLQANLPENIGTVFHLEDSDHATLILEEKKLLNKRMRLQHTVGIDLEKMARDLNVLRHEQGIISQIPESITFFALYGIERPEQLNSIKRWEKNESHKTLAVPLGVRAADDIVSLNLHEKAHGPHGLVAGTTGSGKSEIIQSYILSLAANFHPYEVSFLLIDYKGGGMAGLFKNLPHLLGTITNLDGNESLRAMASIKSELARRQRVFSDHNVNHINAYNKLFKTGKAEEPIPHLFLISDEFAELKKEQPDFMDELISTARIGRSLGVHLILATQKPSGVVNDQIWTNSKFKLALKVQNEADSKEIIKTGDAAFITQPGRAYLQVGNNEIYELFQSAWSGAAYSEQQEELSDNRVYIINELGQGILVNEDLSDSYESNQLKATQLDVVVNYLNDIFKKLQIQPVKRPWLPPLSEQMVSPYTWKLAESNAAINPIPGTASGMVPNREKENLPLDLRIPFGLMDIPEEQKQAEYCLDLVKDGNILFVAAVGYGKSTFLTTALLTLALKNAVDQLHFYILDYGNNALVALNGLPHTADYITFDDDEKLEKLIRLIEQEIKLRKQLFSEKMVQNFQVYNQTAEKPLHAIVLVIDNFDVIKEKGYDMEEIFTKISRDGIGLGIYMIASATRISGIRYATVNNFKNKIAGYLFEKGEATGIVGKGNYELTELKGRALAKQGSVNLMQMYTMVDFATEMEYSNRIKELVTVICQMYPISRAPRIPVLPDIFKFAMLPEYRGQEVPARHGAATGHGAAAAHTTASGQHLPVALGLEIKEVTLRVIQPQDTPFVIIGESKKGKTNNIRIILKQIIGTGQVYLFDNSEMSLFAFGQEDGITYVTKHNFEEFASDLTAECIRRREQFQEALEMNPKCNSRSFYQELEPFYIIIDDADEFIEMSKVHAAAEPNFLKDAAETGIMVIATVHSAKLKGFDDLSKWFKAASNGLVLSAQGMLNIFQVAATREYPAMGSGLLFHNGAYEKIMLMWDEEE